MRSLITSYLLQNKACILPGIGILQIIHSPVTVDTANSRLLPPSDEIIFNNDPHSNSTGLVKYIADKKHISQTEAEELLNDFCKEWKEKIKAGEKLTFETIGSIQKDTNGFISFEKENSINYLQPINISTLYQKKGEEPVSRAVNSLQEEVVIERSYWGIWALILFAIAAVMIFYQFKDHKLTGSSIGNQNNLTIDSSAATHK